MPTFNTIVVIGLGLIGGSLSSAVSRGKLAGRVIGIDPCQENLDAALEQGAIQEAGDFPGSVERADLVVLAIPVMVTMKILKEIGPHLKPGAVVTDTASTKEQIVSAAAGALPDGIYYIGGHPMAGSEKSGYVNSDPYLFENAYYILTPAAGMPSGVLEKLKSLVRGIGAVPLEFSPGEHDSAVAAVSHLPHVVAAALVNTLQGVPRYEDALPLAAGGFRDTTRIAAGNPEMWREILFSNREEVVKMINEYIDHLLKYKHALEQSDSATVLRELQGAQAARSCLPGRKYSWYELHEILVTAPDRPGVIGNIALVLGNNGININEIEVMRVREWEGGTIRLAFITEEEKLSAYNVLTAEGFAVKKK